MDIEFAYDGTDFYLLQCRPQSYGGDVAPAAIPQNLPPDQVLFSANRYVSNGKVPQVTHIVYVDLERYSQLPDQAAMREVGRAVGRLNKLLPKRQFLLIGPGRWGSRGDIKLGVPVTYSDINNTAMLIEVARQRGNYLPELSFGTHFFQDLVEASIRYLPLYPDDPSQVFQEPFLLRSRNILQELLPEFAHLADTLRVIDVPRETGGLVLQVLMNADSAEGVGVFCVAWKKAGEAGAGERAKRRRGGGQRERRDGKQREDIPTAPGQCMAQGDQRDGQEQDGCVRHPVPGPDHPPRLRRAATSAGTTSNKSPTTYRSANSASGASGSRLTATIVSESCMPTRCWIAPGIPRAR